MKKLTDRQHEVLDWICIFRIENEFSPSIQEVADGFGINKIAAYNHILALEKKGYIKSQQDRPRSIRVIKCPSLFYGTVGDLFLQVAPKGTAKFKEKL